MLTFVELHKMNSNAGGGYEHKEGGRAKDGWIRKGRSVENRIGEGAAAQQADDRIKQAELVNRT